MGVKKGESLRNYMKQETEWKRESNASKCNNSPLGWPPCCT